MRRAGAGAAQVLYVGVAQEKQKVFRTSKRRNPVTGATYPWLVPGSGVVNQYYFYCVDEEFGPVCVKFSGYFPYTGRLILNGNEYAKRQAAKAGIGFVPLDNAFAAVDDVAAVQAICDDLDEDAIAALAARLLAILPHPFTADDTAAGYRYELSVLQAEFSLTQMLDAPVNGRIFFDQLIRDNLDLGRPDRVSLIFGRRSSARAGAPRRAGSAPASSPRTSPRACTSTTRTPRSSSTTSSARRSERKWGAPNLPDCGPPVRFIRKGWV